MRTRWLVAWPLSILLILATCLLASSPAPQAALQTRPQPVDFEKQVRPILETRCQPCHFPGGKMYERLPFDRPQTIWTLGNKMFTRIKDEREQAILRAFLAQGIQSQKRLTKRSAASGYRSRRGLLSLNLEPQSFLVRPHRKAGTAFRSPVYPNCRINADLSI